MTFYVFLGLGETVKSFRILNSDLTETIQHVRKEPKILTIEKMMLVMC